MVTELIDVDNAFMALLENQIMVDSQNVPVKFFNPDPKLKTTPEYPSIIIQPFAPVPSLRQVWTHRVTVPNDPDVIIHRPPELRMFRYQVSGFAKDFATYRSLLYAVGKRFPRSMNHQYVTIDAESYDLFHSGISEIPGIGDGTFQFVLNCDIYVPVEMILPETQLAIDNVRIDVRADGMFQTIFTDGFDRANNQDVGNNWIDYWGTVTSEILNNRVRISNASADAGILRVIKASGAVNKRYRLSVDVEVVGGAYAVLWMGEMGGDSWFQHISKQVTNGQHELEFYSTNSSLAIGLRMDDGALGERYFDNLVLRELDTSLL